MGSPSMFLHGRRRSGFGCVGGDGGLGWPLLDIRIFFWMLDGIQCATTKNPLFTYFGREVGSVQDAGCSTEIHMLIISAPGHATVLKTRVVPRTGASSNGIKYMYIRSCRGAGSWKIASKGSLGTVVEK